MRSRRPCDSDGAAARPPRRSRDMPGEPDFTARRRVARRAPARRPSADARRRADRRRARGASPRWPPRPPAARWRRRAAPRRGRRLAGRRAPPLAARPALRRPSTAAAVRRPCRPRCVAEVPITSGDERIGGVVLLEPGGRTPRPSSSCTSPPSPRSPRWRSRRRARRSRRTCAARSWRTSASGPRARPGRRRPARRAARLRPRARRRRALRRADHRAPAPRRRDDRPASTRARSPSTSRAAAGRVYALLPAAADGDAGDDGRRRRRAGRAGCSATASSALSSLLRRPGRARPRDPGGRAGARRPARGDGLGGADHEDIGTGTYRLLFRVLASHPEEVRSFYEDTVAPIVRYDDQYRTDLVETLEAYLEHNCNMNATAAASTPTATPSPTGSSG